MSLWDRLLERPEPDGHLVQFYDCDRTLGYSAGRFLLTGIKQADGLIVIADAWHRELFRDSLAAAGIDTVRGEEEGRILFLDARRTLNSFMRNGQPDWNLFEAAIGNAMALVRPNAASGGLRAYGEMVGLLWSAGRFSAAVRLEQFWNKLLGQTSLSLFCGYRMDLFGEEFQGERVEALLCNHTHVVPGAGSNPEPAIRMAIEEILGAKGAEVDSLLKTQDRAWALMPSGEALVLAVRKELPRAANQILGRARQIHRAFRQQTGTRVM